MKDKIKKFLSPIIAISICVGVLLLDLLTKGLIIKYVVPNVGDSAKVLPPLINFIYVKNTGAAWGIFGGRPIFLIIFTSIILALFITFYVLRVKKSGEKSSILLAVSTGLIVGGALGNLIDRIIFGYVRDFINFMFINFPVFNFADISLTFGVIIVAIYFIFYYSKEEARVKKISENIEKNSENTPKNDKKDEIIIENQKNDDLDKENDNDWRWVFCWC